MGVARHFDLGVGRLALGANDAITDVPGVLVGHKTIIADGLATGVTAVLPHGGDLFRSKVRAAVEIINGFGKSAGLMQLSELGTIETPILLTNTFSVAPCAEALIKRAIAANSEIGRETSTVNPVVCECNDGSINDIQAMAVTRQDAEAALDAASAGPVEQGSIGAGAGMTSFGFKAGIGSASRNLKIGSSVFTLGALVLSNFGRAGNLILPDGRRADPKGLSPPESGSIIIILGTDIPLGDRQLNRVARRAGAGIARLGSYWGHGSGPPAEMIKREASKGRILPEKVEGGPDNPLGARALYIGSTLYRIHGTNQPWTIGEANSSGCIRLTNEDVIDLYQRVPVGAQVVVQR